MKRGMLNRVLASALVLTSMAAPSIAPEADAQQKVRQRAPYTMEAAKDNPVNKYALLVVGSSRGERDALDPIDRNFFWLNGAYDFRYLKELGFEVEMLYADGKPDFTEEVNRETVQYIKENQFNADSREREATIANLEARVDEIAKKADGNDVFVLVIETHGNPFVLEMADGREGLTPEKLREIIERVKPGYGLVYVDACHSGAYIRNIKNATEMLKRLLMQHGMAREALPASFIKHVHAEDYVIISATGDHTYGWGDRGFSGSRYFLESLLDQESDANVDGKVTVKEAFENAKKKAVAHMARIRHYLLTDYKWDDPGDAKKLLREISVVPEMIVGKNASADFYLFDSLYFRKK